MKLPRAEAHFLLHTRRASQLDVAPFAGSIGIRLRLSECMLAVGTAGRVLAEAFWQRLRWRAAGLVCVRSCWKQPHGNRKQSRSTKALVSLTFLPSGSTSDLPGASAWEKNFEKGKQ